MIEAVDAIENETEVMIEIEIGKEIEILIGNGTQVEIDAIEVLVEIGIHEEIETLDAKKIETKNVMMKKQLKKKKK